MGTLDGPETIVLEARANRRRRKWCNARSGPPVFPSSLLVSCYAKLHGLCSRPEPFQDVVHESPARVSKLARALDENYTAVDTVGRPPVISDGVVAAVVGSALTIHRCGLEKLRVLRAPYGSLVTPIRPKSCIIQRGKIIKSRVEHRSTVALLPMEFHCTPFANLTIAIKRILANLRAMENCTSSKRERAR